MSDSSSLQIVSAGTDTYFRHFLLLQFSSFTLTSIQASFGKQIWHVLLNIENYKFIFSFPLHLPYFFNTPKLSTSNFSGDFSTDIH
jgi:hypothetical protein